MAVSEETGKWKKRGKKAVGSHKIWRGGGGVWPKQEKEPQCASHQSGGALGSVMHAHCKALGTKMTIQKQGLNAFYLYIIPSLDSKEFPVSDY